uniref:Fibulin-1 n=1 Tax=Mola mola TaxID=94237 RepID=A0A3Q3VW97_MOLML
QPNPAELQPPTLPECCQDGRTRGLGGQDCTILPHISSAHICRIVQEQCCEAAVGDYLCDNGIRMARGQGACERPFFQGEPGQTKISKMCCDCCMLGLMTASWGSSCELHGLFLGKQCEHSVKTCCGKDTIDETKPNDMLREVHCDVFFFFFVLLSCFFADVACSHFCVDNGTCLCFNGYQLQKDGVTCEENCNRCISTLQYCKMTRKCLNDIYDLILFAFLSVVDIDECILGTHNCGPDFFCTNTAGSFRCHPKETCRDGFFQDAVGTCIACICLSVSQYTTGFLVTLNAYRVLSSDINECVAHASPCLPGQTCLNTEGSYTCRRNTATCGRGYHLSEDGTRCEGARRHNKLILCVLRCTITSVVRATCVATTGVSTSCPCTLTDVNECDNNPCSQECANVYGSYQCYCRRGYQLSDIDGITCEDIDECALSAGGHMCSYLCSNAPGSFYCLCPPTGYTLGINGQTCQDIDECAAGSHTCSVSESCLNIQGGYRCLSFACPPNFQELRNNDTFREISFFMRCIKACQPNDIACNHDPIHLITHTSLSLPNFRDISEPEEIVFLRTLTAENPIPVPGAMDVFFDILSGNEQFSFDVQKRSHQGMIMGVVRQLKPVPGPANISLEVAMNYVKSGVVSHCNIVFVHIFISELWF